MQPKDQPPGLPEQTWLDIEAAQFVLQKCAEYGFPLDELAAGDEDAAYHLACFLEFNQGLAHGLKKPNRKWKGANKYLLTNRPRAE